MQVFVLVRISSFTRPENELKFCLALHQKKKDKRDFIMRTRINFEKKS